ncbi:MAG: TIGR02281 family clan AA aspartic protease [Pseudomonadota bacterium]
MSENAPGKGVGKSMIFAMWILVIAGLTFFFNQWIQERNNPNQYIATNVQDGVQEVVLQRNRAGHYVANGEINGQPVVFLVDTGATDVNIPQRVANRLKLEKGRPQYATTANGTITVYDTTLSSIGIGELRLQNISASINPHMYTEEILLGMSFLQHLELNQKGDALTLSLPL